VVPVSVVAEDLTETDVGGGYTRYRDHHTEELGQLASAFDQVRKTRLALTQRGLMPHSAAILKTEEALGRALNKTLRAHAAWPWLSQFPGLGGVHTARLISRIGDPLRFPGRVCAKGHHLPSDYAGEVCASPIWNSPEEVPEADSRDGAEGWAGADEATCENETANAGTCLAPVGPIRRGTGVQSLWHFCGVHVVGGRAPRLRKGVKADWDPIARTCLLMPGGIAEQIVRLRVPVYRQKYEEKKALLASLRGAECRLEPERKDDPPQDISGAAWSNETEAFNGSATGGAEDLGEPDLRNGPLRPFQIEGIARKVAAKAFLGDLLTAWKRLVLECPSETEKDFGGQP